IGCTRAAALPAEGYAGEAMTGFALARAETTVVTRRLDDLDRFTMKDGYDAAQALLWELSGAAPSADDTNTFAFLTIDGLSLAEERVASAVGMALGAIPLFGGSAADDLKFRDTAVYHDGAFHRRAAVLTLVHSRRPFRVFSTQHYVATPAQVVVTEADPARRMVLALNGRPAAEEYARLLGVVPAELTPQLTAARPLIFRIGGRNYPRGIETVGRDGAITFGCAIDTGLALSIADGVDPAANLEALFGRLRQSLGPLEFTWACDCAVRMLEIRRRGQEGGVARLFRDNAVAGFASFGEQVGTMHVNHTFTGVAFARPEAAAAPEVVTGSARNLLIHEPAADDAPQPPLSAAMAWSEAADSGGGGEVEELRRIVRALIDRSQRDANLHSDNFSLFQNAIVLEDTVRRRTTELLSVNQQLSRELAERREMEEALRVAKAQAEQANRMKSQFLAAIGHDLQQPLNAARLFLGTLSEKVWLDDDLALLDRITESLGAVDDLLGGLLDITSLDSGVVPVAVREVPLKPMIRQLGAEYAPQASLRGVRLKSLAADVAVRTDPALLQRVLRNLLSNALRYTPEGKVLLGCRRRGDGVWIEVWDTGIGMPRERLREIFQEFRRLDNPRAPGGARGLGLGLAIVDRIADMLGLEITVRSEEGRGSVVAVRVPLGSGEAVADRDTADTAREADLERALRGRRVLVLDDDPAILDGMRALLAAWDCVPLTADGFVAAIRALKDPGGPPDLIIADWNIGDPDLTGLDAVQAICARLNRRVPAVVITSSRDREVAEAAGLHGLGLLHKPVRPGQLRSVMALLLLSAGAANAP
ncbi:NahK/ErcS family hybrid sensor histidine kinase/response regulator, partial [Caenispirillum bisanense]|uniref:NahK/ErcS family hybrid sensor histidine kinase/response regulator n=1 Tax=Caenispirillum bisanense TaxID=414052 RepID=UPI0031D2615F